MDRLYHPLLHGARFSCCLHWDFHQLLETEEVVVGHCDNAVLWVCSLEEGLARSHQEEVDSLLANLRWDPLFKVQTHVIVELGCLQAVIVLQEFSSVGSTPSKDEFTQLHVDLVGHFDLQVQNANASIDY